MVSIPGVPFDDPIPLGTGSTAKVAATRPKKNRPKRKPLAISRTQHDVGRCRHCGAAILWVRRHLDERFNKPLEPLSDVVVLDPFDTAVVAMSYRFHHHTDEQVREWAAKQEEGRDERVARLHLKKSLRRAYHPTWRNADEKEAARARTTVKTELRQQTADLREMHNEWALKVDCPVPRCARSAGYRCVNLSNGPKAGQLTNWPHPDRLHQSPKWLAWFAKQTS